MTHSYDHHAEIPPRSKTDRLIVWAVGLTMAAVGAVSLVYLVDQYRDAGPWREALAVKRAMARDAAEAERARRAAVYDPAPVVTPVAPAADSEPPFENMTPDQRRDVERLLAAQRGRQAAPAASPSVPMRWAVRPAWPGVGGDVFPAGATRIGVTFRCTVSRTGVMTRCVATESPAGTGLGARMQPALMAARMEPLMENGRAVPSEVSVSVSFENRPRPVAPTAVPAAVEPLLSIPAAAAPAEPAPEPKPEPAPAG